MDERIDEAGVEEQEINLLDLLRVVVRRKRIILIGCTFAALVSAAYSLSMPNVYSATARVLPPQKEVGGGVSALLGQMGGLAGLAGGALGGSADLYMGILKSRSVADAVIKRLDLQTKFKTKTIDETRSRLAGVVKPVLLAGLTAISGFGSLALARNPALTGLGIACAIGIFWSLIATIFFTLPAMAAAKPKC